MYPERYEFVKEPKGQWGDDTRLSDTKTGNDHQDCAGNQGICHLDVNLPSVHINLKILCSDLHPGQIPCSPNIRDTEDCQRVLSA